DPRTRYHECRGWLAAHARVAVGGKAGVLLVPHEDMADSRGCQSAVQLERVHARDAKDRIDAVSDQRLDDVTADCPSGGAHGVAIVAQRSQSRHMKQPLTKVRGFILVSKHTEHSGALHESESS